MLQKNGTVNAQVNIFKILKTQDHFNTAISGYQAGSNKVKETAID